MKLFNYGIEIEFNMTGDQLALLLADLYCQNIDYVFYDKLDRHKILSSKEILVIKPDESLGPTGWEINIPPTYDWDQIGELLDIIKRFSPEITEKAALHIHIDTYYLSQYEIDQIHEYYYRHQEAIIREAADRNLYLDLNSPVLKNIKDEKRKTRLNIRHALSKHKTIEHRIYKSSLELLDIKWAVYQTINIINKGVN